MERQAEIAERIRSINQLGSVVTAMRGIAASHAQQGRAILAGIEAFDDVVSGAIGQALRLMPQETALPVRPEERRLCLILLCAEQGFAGAFSRRIFDRAGPDIDRATLIMVGTRGAALAMERNKPIEASLRMATQVGAITSTANLITDTLYQLMPRKRLTHVEVIFSRYATGTVPVERRSLLPIDPKRFASEATGDIPPLTMLDPQVLLERLAAEYVFAQLCEAVTQSFAAENEARMEAMSAAKHNIEKTTAALVARERQVRQEAITAEITELTAGTEALRRMLLAAGG